MFSVDPHFRDVITWELTVAVLGAILVILAIVLVVRRLIPATCCRTEGCVSRNAIKQEEGRHESVR